MATRDGWRFFATNLDGAGGEHLIAPNLPIEGSVITSTLSGPGGLTGTIPVEREDLRSKVDFSVFEPWRTCVYAELGGAIRGGGIIADDVDLDDPTISLVCKGFSAYPTGMAYNLNKNYVQADPFTIAREFWSDLQARPHADLGLIVSCAPSATPIRLGQLPVDKWTTIDEKVYANKKVPLLDAGTPFRYVYYNVDDSGHSTKVTRYGVASRTPHYANDDFPEMWWDTDAFRSTRGKLLIWDNGTLEEQEVYDKAHAVFPAGMKNGVIRDASGRIVWAIFGYFTSKTPTADASGDQLQPYKINYYDTLDMGPWWDSLAKDGGFDCYESHAWAPGNNPDPQVGDPVDIVHTLHLGYPTVGRNLRTSETHRFEVGINVTTTPPVTVSADDYCDFVLVVGAGEGSTAVRGTASVPNRGRLHRTKVVQDATIKTKTQAQKRAAQIASSYAGDQDVSSLQIANHSFAPFGSYSVGDTFQLLGSGKGWAADLNLSLRIKEISVSPDEGDYAAVSTARPDKVSSEV